MKSIKKFVVLILSIFFFSAVLLAVGPEPTPADRGMASEEFRRGVQSYYRGSFNEAIIQFEKALAFLPSEPLILNWLGKSYYKSGMENVALSQWQAASDFGYKTLLLNNQMEIIKNRRLSKEYFSEKTRYVLSTSISGKDEYNSFFSQPSCVLPVSDGSFWMTAYGSNELLCLDVNGTIVRRVRGPLNGFDRPMDIIQLKNGNLAITEYAGDRISLLTEKGNYIKSFGQKGNEQGQLLGPQFLAQDSAENIYVTDFGNSRVSVYDKQNEFLFSFGNTRVLNQFDGLKGPTGIAIINDIIFVGDAITGGIYSFDTAGNFLDVLVLPGTFSSIESIKQIDNSLLVADMNKIYSVNIESGSVYETAKVGNAPSKLICAMPDKNANLLVTDFEQNEINVMSKMNELVGGFFVQIEKVVSDKFPNVTIEVKVENRFRQSIAGLKDINFYVSEENRTVSELKYKGEVSQKQDYSIAMIIDKKFSSKNYTKQIETSIQEISKLMNGKGKLIIITAGDIPVIEFVGNPKSCEKFSMSKITSQYTQNCTWDNSIRLAVNNMINDSGKKLVILLTDGTLTDKAFAKYPLTEVSAYLANNSFALSAIMLSQNSLSDELSYLVDKLNGESYYVYRKEGLKDVLSDIDNVPTGLYELSYTSSLSSQYGREFLPVEVEVYLNNRSGRDETGYFAPLE